MPDPAIKTHYLCRCAACRGKDPEDSNLDLLIDVPRGTTYFALSCLKREIETLTGGACDLHTPPSLKELERGRILLGALPL